MRTATGSRARLRTGLTAALGYTLFLLFGGTASAQDADHYPNRPVMMIVPFAPGGASDFVARIIQQGVSDILGQQIVSRTQRDSRSGLAETPQVQILGRI